MLAGQTCDMWLVLLWSLYEQPDWRLSLNDNHIRHPEDRRSSPLLRQPPAKPPPPHALLTCRCLPADCISPFWVHSGALFVSFIENVAALFRANAILPGRDLHLEPPPGRSFTIRIIQTRSRRTPCQFNWTQICTLPHSVRFHTWNYVFPEAANPDLSWSL